MVDSRALPQMPLCGLFQHRTALAGRVGIWPTAHGPLQHPLIAGQVRLGRGLNRVRDTVVLPHAQQTRESSLFPGKTKTALRKLPKAELEEEMRQLSLDTQGTKQKLVDRLHAYLAAQQVQAGDIPEDTSNADTTQSAPQGWLFEAEGEGADLPPDIKALLKQQAEEEQIGGNKDMEPEELEPASSTIFGTSDSPEDLQALPKRELQEKLAQRGLPKSGNKAALAQRLHAALAEEQEMVLQDQMEAHYELQRQFQETMMSPSSRMEAEEQEAALDTASGIPEESIDQWAIDIEAEFQSPDDDAELSFEDAEAAGAMPGTIRDEEGGVLRGRFNGPRVMMDLFEYQGTKAAELAGEDYAAQRRGGAEYSQAMNGGSSAPQQRMARPLDSQDEGDLFNISGADDDAEEEGDDGYDNDIENDLEDGFSMAAEQEADGFDSDVEELNAKEAEGRGMPLSLQAAMSEYIGHRDYKHLSSRSPDDIGEDFGLLDTIIDAASAEPVSEAKADLNTPNSSNTQSVSSTMNSPLNLSRRVPKPQTSKPGQASATVVASQGTSSLDFGTAKDWMSTRLPEAMRLGITPDQLVSDAAPLPLPSQAGAAGRASDSSNALSRGIPKSANRPGLDRKGKVEVEQHASSQAEASEAPLQADPQVDQEQAEMEAAAAEATPIHLDNELLDALAEDVLGRPSAAPEDAAAPQLSDTMSAVQQELGGDEALPIASSVGTGEGNTPGDVSALNASAASLAEASMQAERELEELSTSSDNSALTSVSGEAPANPEAAAPLPNRSEVLDAAASDTVPAQGDQDKMTSSAGLPLAEQDTEADLLIAQHLSDKVHDHADGAATGASDGVGENQAPEESDLTFSSAITETQSGSAVTPEMHDTIIPSEQLEDPTDESSTAVASNSMSPSQTACPDASLDPSITESARDGLSDKYQVPVGTAVSISETSTDLVEGLAEAHPAEAFRAGQPTSVKNQQELAALRAEMAQKQGALAALQSQVAAVGRSNEGNTSQIAQLQVAMAALQSQRLDLQRADLSGRLAVLQDIAAQASLNAAAKEDLQQQLQSMQDELTQLEADLSSRDTEAADLSRKLAHARNKLGDPTAAPPANGTAQASVPGAMRARLGKDTEVGGQHVSEQDDASAQQAADKAGGDAQTGAEAIKRSNTQPGVVVAAGILGAFKAIGGMFRRTERDDNSQKS